MRRWLLDYLACPYCKKELELIVLEQGPEEDLITTGVLYCKQCGRWYPIIDEIPHILPDDLRERDKDLDFLKKWKNELPSKIVTEGKPYS
ncbi:Trm112 family protein, partial [archaeon]|nr:Trm112 family protein [archaeon]